ncbi:hypothetical protein Tco_1305796, partial [Tanacetum coccineum]
SLSKTSMQHVTQPKEKTNKKLKRKKIIASSDPKASKIVRESTSTPQVADTQHIEETVATTSTTQSLKASELVEEQRNQPETTDTTKVQEIIIEKADHAVEEEDHDKGIDSSIMSMGDVRLEDSSINDEDNPFDTKSDIKVLVEEPADSDLHSMFDDKVKSISGFEAADSNEEGTENTQPKVTLTQSEKATADNILDEMAALKASVDKPSDPLGHLWAEISSLSNKVNNLESSLAKKVFSKLEESVPKMVAATFEERMPELISDTLKNILPNIIEESFQQALPKFEEDSGDPAVYCDVNLWELINLMKDMVHLLDSALVFRKANAKGEKWEKANPDPDITKSNIQTTSSAYSSTPPRDENKGKGIATKEEPVKLPMPLIEQGGSDPKMLNLQQFSIFGKKMTLEVVQAQLTEIKWLVDLKAEQEKTEQKLKALSNKELEAQSTQLAAYEAKRKRILEEYNHYITFRVDPLPITKISYKIDKAKFEWIKTQARKLGIPPSPELIAFGLSDAEKKGKRSSEIIKEVFVKEYIVVDGMHSNLIPPPWVKGSRWLVIRELKSVIFFYNRNFDLVFQREEEFHLATTARLIRTQSAIQIGTPEAEEMYKKMKLEIEARKDVSAGIEGLAECKASASNLRRIQVKDIVKKVKDYLKRYTLAGMDISWYIEGIHCGFKEN